MLAPRPGLGVQTTVRCGLLGPGETVKLVGMGCVDRLETCGTIETRRRHG